MPSIDNFIPIIAHLNPNNQPITIRATSPWLNALAAQFPIVNAIATTLRPENNGGRIIMRSDVKKSVKAEEKVVRALIWAYPNGMHNHYDNNILNQLPTLSAVLADVQGCDLNPTDFQQLYNAVTAFRGIGHRTASILLFFFNVRCNGVPCVAVTRYVICAFSDIDEFNHLNANSAYASAIKSISDVAYHHGVTEENVEYFLFEHGQYMLNKTK